MINGSGDARVRTESESKTGQDGWRERKKKYVIGNEGEEGGERKRGMDG